jgi:hypothetical protein
VSACGSAENADSPLLEPLIRRRANWERLQGVALGREGGRRLVSRGHSFSLFLCSGLRRPRFIYELTGHVVAQIEAEEAHELECLDLSAEG